MLWSGLPQCSVPDFKSQSKTDSPAYVNPEYWVAWHSQGRQGSCNSLSHSVGSGISATDLQNLLLLLIQLPAADSNVLIDVRLHSQHLSWDVVPGPDDCHAFPQHLGFDVRILQQLKLQSQAEPAHVASSGVNGLFHMLARHPCAAHGSQRNSIQEYCQRYIDAERQWSHIPG